MTRKQSFSVKEWKAGIEAKSVNENSLREAVAVTAHFEDDEMQTLFALDEAAFYRKAARALMAEARAIEAGRT